MIVPIELPGESVPPLMVVLPTVPLPPSVPPAFTVVRVEVLRSVHRQLAAIDRGVAGVGVCAGEVGTAAAVLLNRPGAGDDPSNW